MLSTFLPEILQAGPCSFLDIHRCLNRVYAVEIRPAALRKELGSMTGIVEEDGQYRLSGK
jgi:hypothetical protein